jgi:acetate kinase
LARNRNRPPMFEAEMKILVCNAGSSSLKFSLFEAEEELLLAEVASIGQENRRGLFSAARVRKNSARSCSLVGLSISRHHGDENVRPVF